MDYYFLEQNREELYRLIKEREEMLRNLTEQLRKELSTVPEGMIKVARKKNSFQYFRKEKSQDKWEYIPKSRRILAERIVNADYRRKLLQEAETDLRAIRNWNQKNIPFCIEDIYDCLPEGRKALIDNIVSTGEEAVREFLSETYEPLKSYSENKIFETSNGEFVRSKAEWMIAERLLRNGIPYQYEYPVQLKNYGTVRPDFRCFHVRKRKVILWEHQGRMDDCDYSSAAIRKINAYEENGFFVGDNLILTSETMTDPLTPRTIERWIRRMLIE